MEGIGPREMELLVAARNDFEARAEGVSVLDRPPPVSLSFVPLVKTEPGAETFEHIQTRGEGATATEAIEDWKSHLPQGQLGHIHWRVPPEIERERDFDTNAFRWCVYSRCAIISRVF